MLVVSSDAVVFEAARETMLDFNPSYPNLCCYAWETMKDGAPGLGQKGISTANFFVIVYDATSIPNKHGGANKVPSANPHPDSDDEDDSSSSSEDASDSSEEEESPKKNKSVVAAMKAAMKKRSARRS